MANDLLQNPMLFTTAVANFAAMGIDNHLVLYVKKISWVGATTAGHTCSIIDQVGNILFSAVADAPNRDYISDYAKPMVLSPNAGWYVNQISSGSLYLYL